MNAAASTGVLLLLMAGLPPGSGSTDEAVVKLLRPAAGDFVEVLRGGEAAMEMMISLRGDFAVPRHGYLVVKGFAAGDEEPAILCPNSVQVLEACERDAVKQLEGTFRLTLFGVELGPQRVNMYIYLAPAHRRSGISTAYRTAHCNTLQHTATHYNSLQDRKSVV